MKEPGDTSSRWSHPSVALYARHVNPSFVRLVGLLGFGRVFVKARDVWLWDHEGRKYLDFLAGFGSVNVGHNHPRLCRALQEFLQEEALNFCHVGPSPHTAALAARLASLLPDPLEVCLFSSSGAEAVEAGLKLARAATGRKELVYCRGGFHGTNLGTLSVMGEERMRKPFEPLLADCTQLSFGDLDALRAALSRKKAAAFLVEPVQAEGGVVLPPEGYLAGAQELCRRYGTLLVLDEVQTGLGRCGRMFAFEDEDFVPDVLVLAKALSGGIAPIAATVTSQKLHGKAYGSMDRFDLHSSTFGGNALCCCAALETLDILMEERLAENACHRGRQLLEGLKSELSGHALVRDVRGRGLLVGIELGPTDRGWTNKLAPSLVRMVSKNVFGQWAALKLLEKGILCQPASHSWNVLRLEPPLSVSAEHVQQAIRCTAEVLSEYEGVSRLLKDVSQRLGKQFLAGWSF